MSAAAALIELCERERAAIAAGDIPALGTIALARVELARKLSPGIEEQALLLRLKAETRRNLRLYEGLMRVTAGYRRWLEGLSSGRVGYGPPAGGGA